MKTVSAKSVLQILGKLETEPRLGHTRRLTINNKEKYSEIFAKQPD